LNIFKVPLLLFSAVLNGIYCIQNNGLVAKAKAALWMQMPLRIKKA